MIWQLRKVLQLTGPGTVYIQDNSGNTTHRQLIVDNGHITASSNIVELRRLSITADTSRYDYYSTSYSSFEGITVHTTSSPSWSNGRLSNVFSGANNFYYTTSHTPTLTYTFAYPVTMDHLKIFPQCGSSYWTNYRVDAYLGTNKVFDQTSWTATRLCYQGQYGQVNLQKEVDKVKLISVFLKDSVNLTP